MWLATSLLCKSPVARVNQPALITSKVNRNIRHNLFGSDLGQRLFHFLRCFTYNSKIFQRIILQDNLPHLKLKTF